MQVACTSTPEGRVYRFYRASGDFTNALKPLVPFLLASRADVIVGSEDSDPTLMLRVGPLDDEAETLFLSLIASRLTCRCSPPRTSQ